MYCDHQSHQALYVADDLLGLLADLWGGPPGLPARRRHAFCQIFELCHAVWFMSAFPGYVMIPDPAVGILQAFIHRLVKEVRG